MKLLQLNKHRQQMASHWRYGEMFSRVVDDFKVFNFPKSPGKFFIQQVIRESSADVVLLPGDRSFRFYKQALKLGIPYILIENDITTLRGEIEHGMEEEYKDKAEEYEKEMIESAAAVILTSEEHQYHLDSKYDLPYNEVVHLRPFKSMLDFEPLPKLEGKNIVYAGGVHTSDQIDKAMGYRVYNAEIFPKLIESGWTVHAYVPYNVRYNIIRDYERIGCVLHEFVPEPDLPKELSQYQVGLQSYSFEQATLDGERYCNKCRPNKLWSYLAANIPTVGYNTGRGGDVYDGKWGLIADSLDELPAKAEEASRMRIDGRTRKAQVIDKDIEKFERLVEECETG